MTDMLTKLKTIRENNTPTHFTPQQIHLLTTLKVLEGQSLTLAGIIRKDLAIDVDTEISKSVISQYSDMLNYFMLTSFYAFLPDGSVEVTKITYIEHSISIKASAFDDLEQLVSVILEGNYEDIFSPERDDFMIKKVFTELLKGDLDLYTA